ncbi:MAG: mechanosensitive ion channel domain-containing protein [Bacteroidota bacterium]
MYKMLTRRTALLLLFAFSFLVNAFAQAQQAPPVTLESPYNTMLVHLYYLQPDSYEPAIAAKTINLADSLQARKLAIQLKQVLDGRGLFVHLNLLPQESDYEDTLTHKPYYTPFPTQLPEVYLEKIDDQWYYAGQTVEAVPRLHKELYPFGTDFLVNLFPKGAQRQFLGLATWQWVGIGVLLILTWLFQFVLARILRPMVKWLAKSRYSSPLEDKGMLWKVARLSSFVILLWLLKSSLPLLQFTVRANSFILVGLEVTRIVFWVLLGLSIVNVVMQYALRYATLTEHKLDEQLIPILRRMLKIVVVIVGLIYVLQLLDVNVTALIAGVSIGGLALALAAQDTVKNLIGSAMIFFDKPFQIGDWVSAGGNEGEIVEVGFRSTRIRTVDTTIIAVPNNVIASGAVTNMGVRTMRVFSVTLGVTYDTPPLLLEKFIEGLKQLIESHPKTKKDNYLVHFRAFGSSSLNIMFRTHLFTTSYPEELQLKEELSFGILRLAEALGVRFAFPTQTLFVEEMPGKTSMTPTYVKDAEKLDERIKTFFAENKYES